MYVTSDDCQTANVKQRKSNTINEYLKEAVGRKTANERNTIQSSKARHNTVLLTNIVEGLR